MSGHTCGIACWTAQDDICHCSCGGVNHGCLRTADGTQPVRSRKHQGVFYELHRVIKGYKEMMMLRQNEPDLFKQVAYYKPATTAEIMKWPELKAYRTMSPVQRIMDPILLFWVKSTKYN